METYQQGDRHGLAEDIIPWEKRERQGADGVCLIGIRRLIRESKGACARGRAIPFSRPVQAGSAGAEIVRCDSCGHTTAAGAFCSEDIDPTGPRIVISITCPSCAKQWPMLPWEHNPRRS